MTKEDLVAAIEMLGRRLDEAYDSDDAQIIITRAGISLDNDNGDILVDDGSAAECVDQLLKDAQVT